MWKKIWVPLVMGMAVMSAAADKGAADTPHPVKYIVVSKINGELMQRLRDQIPPAAFDLVRESAKTNYIPTVKEVTDLGVPPDAAELLLQHVSHITNLRVKGIVTHGGPTADFDRAINLFVAASEEEARTFHDGDAWVKSGLLSIEVIYPWRQAF